MFTYLLVLMQLLSHLSWYYHIVDEYRGELPEAIKKTKRPPKVIFNFHQALVIGIKTQLESTSWS